MDASIRHHGDPNDLDKVSYNQSIIIPMPAVLELIERSTNSINCNLGSAASNLIHTRSPSRGIDIGERHQ